MRRTLASVLSASALMWAPCAHAVDFGDAEIVAEEELSGMRGGFTTPAGLNINFAATINTFVDGQLALATELTFTQAGTVMQTQTGDLGQPLAEIAEETREQLNIPGVTDPAATGVVLADEAGVTALVHRTVEGSFQNFVVNDANGRDIEQQIALTITLPGFEIEQANMLLDHLGFQINGDIAGAP
ncbi:MAG: hypothetical protein AB7J28_10780 [Hyphomonadaceae bacterium]